EDPHAGLPDPAALVERVPDLDLGDGGEDLAPEGKIEIARRAEAAALESDPRITNSEGAEYSNRHARYAYATSHGFVHGYATTSFGISVAPIASRNGEMQRDYWYSTSRKRARLEDPAAVGRTAACSSGRAFSSPICSTRTAPASSASSPHTTRAGTAAASRSRRATSCCCRARRRRAS